MNGTELMDRVRPVEHRLPSGLTLLVHADDSAPVVAIVTLVRAGYFDEPDHLVGVSHVLEHMYFKGTPRRGVGEIARATKSVGGYLNAGTIYDRTSYYAVLPSSSVDEGLDIQSDALINSRIDEEELRRELVVIIEEVKRKLDNPSALATEKLYEAMFDAHPMRRWRMGEPDSLARFTREDLLAYYRSMYRASNIVLVVSGAVDPGRVIGRVEELYAGVPAGGDERPVRQEPERIGARVREMSGDIAHSYLELGWRTPGTLHPDTPVLTALAAILGQGRASRLYRGVRERGLVSSIGAYNYTPTEIGVFGVGMECEPERTVDAARATWREIDQVRKTPVTDAELERIITLLESRLLRRLETAEGRANLLAEWQALGHRSHVSDYVDRVRSLTAQDVREVAARYLDPDRLTLLAYRPTGTPALEWSGSDLPALLDAGSSAATVPGLPGQDGAMAAGADAPSLAREMAAVRTGSRAIEDDVVLYELDGARVVVKRRAHAPLVSLAVARCGGVLRESPATAGITGLMGRAALKGTAARSAEQIAMESERLGGSIGTSTGADLVSWSLTVPSARFAEGLALLTDVALNPAFPDAAVATERELSLASLERVRDDMAAYPLRLLLKAAFGDHPYGLGIDAALEALQSVTADEVRRWHAQELAEPWIFVVGDAEPDRVAEALAGAGMPSSSVGRLDAPAPRWPDAPRREEVRRDKAQTALALGFPGPSRSHPDRVALEVLANAVSGLGNRLFEELRSRRSLAYSVTAYPLVRSQAGAFVGYIATTPDRGEEARIALLQELTRLRNAPPSEEELERARRYTIGMWQIRTQTNAAQLSDLAVALMLGEGLAEIREFEGRVDSVSREGTFEAVNRWFDEDRLVEGVIVGTGGRGAGVD